MSQWSYAAYIARLKHETKGADTERGMTRLRRTLVEVMQFLNDTDKDGDEDGWIKLLREYEIAAEICGLRDEWPEGRHLVTGVV